MNRITSKIVRVEVYRVEPPPSPPPPRTDVSAPSPQCEPTCQTCEDQS